MLFDPDGDDAALVAAGGGTAGRNSTFGAGGAAAGPSERGHGHSRGASSVPASTAIHAGGGIRPSTSGGGGRSMKDRSGDNVRSIALPSPTRPSGQPGPASPASSRGGAGPGPNVPMFRIRDVDAADIQTVLQGAAGGGGGSASGGTSSVPRTPKTTDRPASGGSGGRGGMTPRELAEEALMELELAAQDVLSAEMLCELAGTTDLNAVTSLELSIDTTSQSASSLALCPNLRTLKLNDSHLASFRDLGTALRQLAVLWVSRCGLKDLDGVSVLESVQELYASFNDIEDLTPLSLHDSLQVLDLEANRVSDLEQLEHLASCARLTALNLDANPISTIDNYRRIVVYFIPQLEYLDDEPITDDDREPLDDSDVAAAAAALKSLAARTSSSTSSGAAPTGSGRAGRGSSAQDDEDLDLAQADAMMSTLEDADDPIHDLSKNDEAVMKEEVLMVADGIKQVHSELYSPQPAMTLMYGGRPMSERSPERGRTAGGIERPRTASGATRRPSIMEQWTEFQRTVTAGGRPSDEFADSVTRKLILARSKLELQDLDVDSTSSSLTHGSNVVVAGNFARSMRKRRNDPKTGAGDSMTITDMLDRTAELERRNESRDKVIAELKAWDLDAAVAKLRAESRQSGLSAAVQRPGTSAGIVGRMTPHKSSSSLGMGSTRSLDAGPSAAPASGAPSKPPLAGSGGAAAMRRPASAAPAGGTAGFAPRGQSNSLFAARRPTAGSEGSGKANILTIVDEAPEPVIGGSRLSISVDESDSDAMPLVQPSPPASGPLTRVTPPLPAETESLGEGNFSTDTELVNMLRMRPKHVPCLRSRDAFRQYFRGISESRMRRLLETAYNDLPEPERMDKVLKRMSLLDGLMTSTPEPRS